MLIRERRIQHGGARALVGGSVEKDLHSVLEIDRMLSQEAYYGIGVIVIRPDELGSVSVSFVLLLLPPLGALGWNVRAPWFYMAKHMVPPFVGQNVSDHAGIIGDDRRVEHDDRSVQAVYVRFDEREPRHRHSNVAAELHECVRHLKQLIRNFDDRSPEAHYGYGAQKETEKQPHPTQSSLAGRGLGNEGFG